MQWPYQSKIVGASPAWYHSCFVCCQDLTSKSLGGSVVAIACPIICCKGSDVFFFFNAETLKTVPTPLFGRLVRCSGLDTLSLDYVRCTQHFWQALSHACACHYYSMLSPGITFWYLMRLATGIEHFMHSLCMGIFKHTGCSCGDEGWTHLPEDITEDCMSWLQTFINTYSNSITSSKQAMHVQPLNHISLINSARLSAVKLHAGQHDEWSLWH